MLGEPLLRRRLEPLLALGAVAAIAALVAALVTVIPGRPAAVSLARFLAAHHLRNGMAGYWNADSTTLVSGDRVIVRPVEFRPGHGLSLYRWEIDGRLLDRAANDVNFLVATAPAPHSPATVTSAEAIAQFGRPYRQYRYQGLRDHGVAEESARGAGKLRRGRLDAVRAVEWTGHISGRPESRGDVMSSLPSSIRQRAPAIF